jgi:hypothetical protein
VPGKAEGPSSLIHNGKDLCTLEALEGEGAGVGEPAAAKKTDETELGRRRTRGQPEAPPRPGERDISKPMITLPPQIQELLDRVTKTPTVPKVPELDSDDVPAPDTLLDYLLAP